MTARDLCLPHVDQCGLTNAVAGLRELQEFLVPLECLLGEIGLRDRLQHGQVLLGDPRDEHILDARDIGVRGALLGFRESGLRQRRPGELVGEAQIIERGKRGHRLGEALRQKRLRTRSRVRHSSRCIEAREDQARVGVAHRPGGGAPIVLGPSIAWIVLPGDGNRVGKRERCGVRASGCWMLCDNGSGGGTGHK